MDRVLIDIRNEDDAIVNQFKGSDTVSVEDLLNKIVDLSWEIEHLEEEKEDIIRDREDNYRALTVEEQVGWSHNW